MIKDDLCYLPTNGLCRINEVLDDTFFPKDKESIIKQELITYSRKDGAIKKVTFKRDFIGNRHTDSTSTEIFSMGVNNGTNK